ncbi:hypothetical protein C7475_11134 [Chitinophaga sp. S165]|nr:hypothetical protein C7475_11134 [Chitinophaga sp. S165]
MCLNRTFNHQLGKGAPLHPEVMRFTYTSFSLTARYISASQTYLYPMKKLLVLTVMIALSSTGISQNHITQFQENGEYGYKNESSGIGFPPCQLAGKDRIDELRCCTCGGVNFLLKHRIVPVQNIKDLCIGLFTFSVL